MENLQSALSYAAKGWAVLPLHTPTKEGRCSCGKPDCKGKHPRVKNGVHDATKDKAVIEAWWRTWPQANIGLATGEASGGALVIDFENEPLYQDWLKSFGSLSERLTIQKTGRGYHAILRCEEPGGNIKLAKTATGETLIETRANGGYIMAAPSLHPNGKRYELVQGTFTAVSNFKMSDVDRMLMEARRYDSDAKPAEPHNPLHDLLVSSDEILDQQGEPADWLTHKFIERGELVLLTAPGGSMKSLLMLSWAASVATGRRWITQPGGEGGRICKPTPVLWINTDNSEKTHAGRWRAVLRAIDERNVPLYSITITDFELNSPEHITRLHDIADDIGAGVIVIDTLSGALTGIDENSAKEMTAPAAHLRALTVNNRTVIGLHHPPKNDVNGSRGSSVLPSKVDRAYTLTREDDLLTIKPTKERNRPSIPFTAVAAIEADEATETLVRVTFFDGNAAKQDKVDEGLRDKIRAALDGEGEGLSQNVLHTKTKISKPILKRILSTMLMTREVVKIDGARGAEIYKLR